MKRDCYDLPVSLESEEELDALNQFHAQLLESGTEGAKIIDSADKYPNACIIHCYAAAIFLYGQENALDKKALKLLNTAEKMLAGVTERERLIFQAIKAWHALDYDLAATLLTVIIQQWPRDCTSGKMVEWIYYCSGQAFHAKPFLAICETMHSHCKEHAGFLAMHSFALELNSRYGEAMEMAICALKINPSTPWAHHTIGHVTLNTSKIDEGIALFHEFAPTWELILPPLRGHLYWHYALYLIAKRDESAANQYYEGGMWGTSPDTVLEQLDSISFLWRMEMAGMPQNQKLKQLVKHLHSHPFEFHMPFANAHYIYALSRSGDAAGVKRMLELTRHYIQTLRGGERRLWNDITLPLLLGCAAFGKGDYHAAATHLAPIMRSITEVGGSDAQDELFSQAYCVSLLKSGKHKEGHHILSTSLAHYKPTPLGSYWAHLTRSSAT